MGKNSAISWTDHTFNPWWGCVEVSPACDFCYARQWAIRTGHNELWNGSAAHPIREFSDKHWQEPMAWNAQAMKLGRRARVFCGSMCDVFEVHPGAEKIRPRLRELIVQTQDLDWLMLTKRGLEIKNHPDFTSLPNVRTGVTVEQPDYVWRIRPEVSWISAEPLLGPLKLDFAGFPALNWVIIGGESKQGADHTPRETKLEWLTDIIEDAHAAGRRVHMKQTGDHLARVLGLKDKSGKDPGEWPESIRVQEFAA